MQISSLTQQAKDGDRAASYAGEATPAQAWDFLSANPKSILVDVRTPAEWMFVGTPDMSSIGKKPVLLPWKLYPQFSLNPAFADGLAQTGAIADTPLFFLCRSGGRSLDAAIAMTAQGYTHCFNITGGFEGDHNAEGHRNSINGWRAAGLPWGQS